MMRDRYAEEDEAMANEDPFGIVCLAMALVILMPLDLFEWNSKWIFGDFV